MVDGFSQPAFIVPISGGRGGGGGGYNSLMKPLAQDQRDGQLQKCGQLMGEGLTES